MFLEPLTDVTNKVGVAAKPKPNHREKQAKTDKKEKRKKATCSCQSQFDICPFFSGWNACFHCHVYVGKFLSS